MDREEKGSEMSHDYMGLCGKSGCAITSRDDPGNEHAQKVGPRSSPGPPRNWR